MAQAQLQKANREGAAGTTPAAAGAAEAQPGRAAGMGRVGWAVLAGVILLINLPLILRALRPAQPATVEIPYSDDFSDRSTIERNYWTTGGHWRVLEGELSAPGVKNNPLWLKARLPQDVAVEFDARSDSPEGDIKVEIFGDGLNHSSGYVLIHGGWNNRLSIISRLNEHGTSLEDLKRRAEKIAADRGLPNAGLVETGVFKPGTQMRVEASPFPVQQGKTYRWRIERRGSLIRWSIDGQPFMEFDDPFPLAGKGHDRFGFSAWESYLSFDNLKVQPL